MRSMTSFKTSALFAVLCLFAVAVSAEGMGDMASGAMMDSMKEKAVDKGSEMATDQMKSAMGLKGDSEEAGEDESAESEAAEAAEAAEGESEAKE